ncbi:ATP-binding cassette domain-containing protein [Clostridium sp. YIM B02515]|uniref:ATP-binding cassette domain-containing protein n=1 Tax=Clostridium rhizosphaerae TaxID=2803861 RepID=A0ABS1TD72_9CLOT|nr:ATP-binding cassette domain-containing protein [Clostridium rhizosphaerae]MBL4937308.1 ATP-binding cassette domain-containing protein [Clostridium rhizosphaerae]
MSLIVDIKKKLKDFSLEIFVKTDGEYLGVLGASGSGKSMTLKCIAGVETPDEGVIVLNGKVLFDSKKKINLKPQDRNIGYLFQNYALFPHMTVEENMGLALTKKEKEQKVSKMIEAFHLKGLENKYPNQISGGQQQRAALARCIIYKPEILMLDEPFSALDSHLKDQLQDGVLELLKLYDGEVMMVSHCMNEVYRFCKKLAIIDKGKSVLLGDTKEVFNQPKLHAAAQLIGCKNISRCEILTSNTVYAIDWGIILETERIITKNTKYIGIHTHDFKAIDVDKAESEKNVMKCRIDKIVEDVFEYNIFLQNKESSKENSNADILFKINKEEWKDRKDKENVYLKVPEEAILLLE